MCGLRVYSLLSSMRSDVIAGWRFHGRDLIMEFVQLLGMTLVAATAICFAQTTSTSIIGTVTDASGASVSGAKVTATNVRTSVASSTVTTETGDYAFPILDIGEYRV